MWFSASIRHVVIIEDFGADSFVDTVFVIDAPSRAEARATALKLGKSKEVEYLNGARKRVRWAFVQVTTLDELGQVRREGTEVFSLASDVDMDARNWRLDHEFSPDLFEPGSSGVPPQ